MQTEAGSKCNANYTDNVPSSTQVQDGGFLPTAEDSELTNVSENRTPFDEMSLTTLDETLLPLTPGSIFSPETTREIIQLDERHTFSSTMLHAASEVTPLSGTQRVPRENNILGNANNSGQSEISMVIQMLQTLNTNVSTMKTDISKMKTDVSTLNTNFSNMQTDFNKGFDNIDTSFSNFQTSLNTNFSRLKKTSDQCSNPVDREIREASDERKTDTTPQVNDSVVADISSECKQKGSVSNVCEDNAKSDTSQHDVTGRKHGVHDQLSAPTHNQTDEGELPRVYSLSKHAAAGIITPKQIPDTLAEQNKPANEQKGTITQKHDSFEIQSNEINDHRNTTTQVNSPNMECENVTSQSADDRQNTRALAEDAHVEEALDITSRNHTTESEDVKSESKTEVYDICVTETDFSSQNSEPVSYISDVILTEITVPFEMSHQNGIDKLQSNELSHHVGAQTKFVPTSQEGKCLNEIRGKTNDKFTQKFEMYDLGASALISAVHTTYHPDVKHELSEDTTQSGNMSSRLGAQISLHFAQSEQYCLKHKQIQLYSRYKSVYSQVVCTITCDYIITVLPQNECNTQDCFQVYHRWRNKRTVFLRDYFGTAKGSHEHNSPPSIHANDLKTIDASPVETTKHDTETFYCDIIS